MAESQRRRGPVFLGWELTSGCHEHWVRWLKHGKTGSFRVFVFCSSGLQQAELFQFKWLARGVCKEDFVRIRCHQKLTVSARSCSLRHLFSWEVCKALMKETSDVLATSVREALSACRGGVLGPFREADAFVLRSYLLGEVHLAFVISFCLNPGLRGFELGFFLTGFGPRDFRAS